MAARGDYGRNEALGGWSTMSINHLIDTYGYGAVFAFVGVESLGIPVPGETALIAAGAYAGRTHLLSPWFIFAVACAGAILGDNVGFELGARGGYRLARRYGHRIRLDERKLKVARYVFDVHGAKVVFLGRFVTILRVYAAFLAGTSRMPWRRFWPANAAGGIVWAAVFTVASYLAGNALTHLSSTLDLIVGAVVVLSFATVVMVVRGGPTSSPPKPRPHTRVRLTPSPKSTGRTEGGTLTRDLGIRSSLRPDPTGVHVPSHSIRSDARAQRRFRQRRRHRWIPRRTQPRSRDSVRRAWFYSRFARGLCRGSDGGTRCD